MRRILFAVDKVPRHAGRKKQARKRKTPLHNLQNASLINDKSDWNGTMFPFRGTNQLYQTEPEEKHNEIDDSEWICDNKTTEKVKVNNSLRSLMCAYDSSEGSDVEPSVPDVKCKGSDNEAPLEEKIVKAVEVLPATTDAPNNESSAPVGLKSRKRKRMKGNKQNQRPKVVKNDRKVVGRVGSSFERQVFKKRRLTLLERLLDHEIRHERNVLLQCVRYVVTNNYFLRTVDADMNDSDK